MIRAVRNTLLMKTSYRILWSPLALLWVLALVSAQPCLAGPSDQTLDIYWIDVEGGGATLIVTPQGQSVLIDAGNPGVRDSGRIHKVATQMAGLKRIDHLVTTHLHLDHFGGAAELSALMPIGTVWNNGIPETSPDNNPNDTRWRITIKPYAEFKAEERKVIHPGDTLPLTPPKNGTALSLRCFAAKQQFIAVPENASPNPSCSLSKPKDKDTSDNANSIALVLGFGPFRFFDGGDLSWNIESALVCPVNRVGEVDVFQVNHHGLDQSNNPILVHSLAPTVSVMNNGSKKGTEPETVATLASVPSIKARYQLHKNVRPDKANSAPDDFIANVDADCKGQPIKLSVSPAGDTYTISIPSTGHAQTYATRMGKKNPTP